MMMQKGLGSMSGVSGTSRVLTAMFIATLAIAPASAAQGPVRYSCPASEDLSIERNRSTAHVNFAGQTYDLQRQRSSIGDKYVSQKAALIIDGRSAIFVAENLIDLGTCTKTIPIASAH